MATAKFSVPFDDFDYRSMIVACGAELKKQTPRAGGGFVLTVVGSEKSIKSLAGDLDFGPDSIAP